MEQDINPRSKSTHLWSMNLWQWKQESINTMVKTVSSVIDAYGIY